MFHYSKKEVDIIALILATILFVLVFNVYPVKSSVPKLNKITEQQNTVQANITNVNEKETEEKIAEEIWQLEIPKIELKAKIAEGTKKETMDQYIGHFEETSKLNGNIGLAAHNRGYPVNYFEKLKELQKYDVIIYKINDKTQVYIVETIEVIEDTNWSYLQETTDNKITLITCVENRANLRLCVQAKAIL